MIRAPRAVLIGGVLAAAACRGNVDTAWRTIPEGRWRPVAIAASTRTGFDALEASVTGLAAVNTVDDEHAMANRNLLLGAGAAVGDLDGDGLADVFLASTEGKGTLYHNDGGLHFTDVTRASGMGAIPIGTTGAAVADVDGDADLDLLIGTRGGPLMLWRNDGKAHFTDATTQSGLVGGLAVTSLTLADVDNDGDLDLYAATYKKRNALDAYPPQERTFDQVVKKEGSRYYVVPRWTAEYRVEDRPDLGGVVRTQRADADLFFLNDGAGHFARTPFTGGRFLDTEGHPLAADPDFFTLAARFYDVNGDGNPDLYVCNDFEDPDQFWLGDGAGHFRLVPTNALTATSNTCMSVDFADVNRDGLVDIFTADMLSPTRRERLQQIPTHTPLPKGIGAPRDRPQWMRNMLHIGRDDGSWVETGQVAGVSATDWTWGSAFVDVDLDGFEDLLIANGHRWDIRNADTYEKIRNAFPRVSWNREQGEFPRLAVPDLAFRNVQDGTFEEASARWSFGGVGDISHTLVPTDLDGDGDLDVLVTRLGMAPRVYRNVSAAPRVAIRVMGRGGVGAQVTVTGTSVPTQRREVTAGGYYLGGVDGALTFATGRDTSVTVEVRWRDGRQQTLTHVVPNRLYEVSPPTTAPVAPTKAARAPVLFTDATGLLGGQTHQEVLYDDFRRQPLLPERLSQGGPGVSWVDLDGDGVDELVVGSGRGGRATALRYVGGRFEARAVGGVAAGDLTTLVPLPQRDGGVALVAGQSWYETATMQEAQGMPPVVPVVGRGAMPIVRPPAIAPYPGAVGALALGDMRGNGSLSLFVGARVRPGEWPLAAASYLLQRDTSGAWVLDTENAEVLRKVGLVTAATWSDLTGDGLPELILVGEFGPVRVLRNVRGHLEDATRAFGLSDMTSRWRGVASGDFDGDGRMDLVVTADGMNNEWGASADRPRTLYVGDFGSGVGLIPARADAGSTREFALESYPRMAFAIPSVRERLTTFAAYAAADMDTVLGPFLRKAARIGVTTTAQTVLLNRGDHFDITPLPAMAQWSSAHGIAVADFDGDGHDDLVLAQNTFPTNVEQPRLDGGVGLVLLGDGRGGFRPLSPLSAGLVVRGDARGAAVADYDGDGRADVAIGQNAGLTTLWHNTGGRPGIRVTLQGPAGNPSAIGGVIRVLTATGAGPAREVRAGSGYWSVDSPTVVMARPAGATAIEVRWPGGAVTRTPLEATRQALRIVAPQ